MSDDEYASDYLSDRYDLDEDDIYEQIEIMKKNNIDIGEIVAYKIDKKSVLTSEDLILFFESDHPLELIQYSFYTDLGHVKIKNECLRANKLVGVTDKWFYWELLRSNLCEHNQNYSRDVVNHYKNINDDTSYVVGELLALMFNYSVNTNYYFDIFMMLIENKELCFVQSQNNKNEENYSLSHFLRRYTNGHLSFDDGMIKIDNQFIELGRKLTLNDGLIEIITYTMIKFNELSMSNQIIFVNKICEWLSGIDILTIISPYMTNHQQNGIRLFQDYLFDNYPLDKWYLSDSHLDKSPHISNDNENDFTKRIVHKNNILAISNNTSLLRELSQRYPYLKNTIIKRMIYSHHHDTLSDVFPDIAQMDIVEVVREFINEHQKI